MESGILKGKGAHITHYNNFIDVTKEAINVDMCVLRLLFMRLLEIGAEGGVVERGQMPPSPSKNFFYS
jgi:hypothetical protein